MGTEIAADATIEKEEKDKGKVTILVDNKKHHLESGTYLVSELKKIVKIDAALQLEQVICGEFKPLEDGSTVTLTGGEIFISHTRQGGSS